MSSRVLVTGARGNLGRALVAAFDESGWQVTSANRSNPTIVSESDSAEQEIELDLTDDAQGWQLARWVRQLAFFISIRGGRIAFDDVRLQR